MWENTLCCLRGVQWSKSEGLAMTESSLFTDDVSLTLECLQILTSDASSLAPTLHSLPQTIRRSPTCCWTRQRIWAFYRKYKMLIPFLYTAPPSVLSCWHSEGGLSIALISRSWLRMFLGDVPQGEATKVMTIKNSRWKTTTQQGNSFYCAQLLLNDLYHVDHEMRLPLHMAWWKWCIISCLYS